jgi:hypothetical protein
LFYKKILNCFRLGTACGVLHILAAVQALKMVIRVIHPYQIETPIVKFYNEPFNLITANENSQGTLYILWLDHGRLPNTENWTTVCQTLEN